MYKIWALLSCVYKRRIFSVIKSGQIHLEILTLHFHFLRNGRGSPGEIVCCFYLANNHCLKAVLVLADTVSMMKGTGKVPVSESLKWYYWIYVTVLCLCDYKCVFSGTNTMQIHFDLILPYPAHRYCDLRVCLWYVTTLILQHNTASVLFSTGGEGSRRKIWPSLQTCETRSSQSTVILFHVQSMASYSLFLELQKKENTAFHFFISVDLVVCTYSNTACVYNMPVSFTFLQHCPLPILDNWWLWFVYLTVHPHGGWILPVWARMAVKIPASSHLQ